MTIEKGEPWGSAFTGELPNLRAADDSDLARLAHEHRAHGHRPQVLVGVGDVADTIGTGGAFPDGVSTQVRHHRYPMDLGYVSLGRRVGDVARTVPFVANVVGVGSRGRWLPWAAPWPELIVMNTPLAGGLRLGPRAHPNDGKLDVTVGSLPWRQAREAVARSATGSHLPHPLLDVRRRAEADFSPRSPLRVTVDGVDHGRWSWLAVRIEPDAFDLIARVA